MKYPRMWIAAMGGALKALQEEGVPREDVPEEVLILLADDPDSYIRSFVAENERLPQSVQKHLIKDPASIVRRQLATNAGVSNWVLEQLLEDNDSDVRGAAKYELHEREEG